MSGANVDVEDVKSSQLHALHNWRQNLSVFALMFAALMLLHAPLLRLPYFWDEAGYYIPAAHDLYVSGILIPQSTVSNAHPPLVMAWLAFAWRVFGFSAFATRTAMLGVAAFALLGIFRLARAAANIQVAVATTILVALYPVFFSQSSMAHLDLAAAGFTFWGLSAYVEDRPLGQTVWFTLAALTKETAILAPIALFAWEMVWKALLSRNAAPKAVGSKFASACSGETQHAASLRKFDDFIPVRKSHATVLLFPLLPLACWYGFHYWKTGYLLGNPEFYRYNVAATLDLSRIPIALGIRVWHLFGYFGLWLLTLAGLLAMWRRPRSVSPALSLQKTERQGRGTLPSTVLPRIPIWIQGAFFFVALAYAIFMAVIGGAPLARYMLPALPLIMMIWISTLWRRLRSWALIVAVIAIVFVVGLFHNPPYGFSMEDNLAYRDFVMLQEQAIGFVEMRFPHARVLTAWPASDELNRPWLGYVSRPFSVVRVEDFRATEIAKASDERSQFDVALVFSTKYEPRHAMFENWEWWRKIKERYFGYHKDLKPEEIAERLGGRLLFRKEVKGQWVGVIGMTPE